MGLSVREAIEVQFAEDVEVAGNEVLRIGEAPRGD